MYICEYIDIFLDFCVFIEFKDVSLDVNGDCFYVV